mgnify:CR=1 FL=1
MSDLHISLVAEGTTDKIAIEAFLSAIIKKSFVMTLLQPETLNAFNGNFGAKGSGWCGVARWCRAKAAEGFGNFENDPTMQHFDLVIIHLAMEAWIVAALFPGQNEFGDSLESTPNPDKRLAARSLTLRLRKNTRDYKALAIKFTEGWPSAITTCSQAARFDHDVKCHLRDVV